MSPVEGKAGAPKYLAAHVSLGTMKMSSMAEGGPERRSMLTQDIVARTGIDEAMIERLVHGFYARVRDDELLGPIFAARIKDWDTHLAKMCAFWSSVALMSGVYHGQPMRAHLPLPVDTPHFDRWLELFAETAHEICPPAASVHFIVRAQRIAESFELGVAAFRGEIKPLRRRSPLAAPAAD